MSWSDFLTPFFKPLLAFGPFWTIFFIALFLSLLVTLIYKLITNQELMKKLKEEQKELQKKIKSSKDNPSEMIKLQKEIMKKNLEYMKHSFKSTFLTFIPLLIVFAWMNSHLAYEPIFPQESYSLTVFFKENLSGKVELIPDKETQVLSNPLQEVRPEVTWKLRTNTSGYHLLQIKYNNQSYAKKVLITKELAYEKPLTTFPHSDLKGIKINYKKLKPLGPSFTLFGWSPGWLSLYIFFSMVFSILSRKLLKVY